MCELVFEQPLMGNMQLWELTELRWNTYYNVSLSTSIKQYMVHKDHSLVSNNFNCYVQYTHNKWYFLSLITHLFLIITFFIKYTSVNLIRMFFTIFFIRISIHITNIYLSECCTLYKDQVYTIFGKEKVWETQIYQQMSAMDN